MITNATLLSLIIKDYHENSSAWRFRGDSAEISEIRKYLQSLKPNDSVSTDVIAKLFGIFSPKIKAWSGSLPLSATLNTFLVMMDHISANLNFAHANGSKLDLLDWQYLCRKFTTNSSLEKIVSLKTERELPKPLLESIVYIAPAKKYTSYSKQKLGLSFKPQHVSNNKYSNGFTFDLENDAIVAKIFRGDSLDSEEEQTLKEAICNQLICADLVGVNNPLFWEGLLKYLSNDNIYSKMLSFNLSKFSLNDYWTENHKSQDTLDSCDKKARRIDANDDSFGSWKRELSENVQVLYEFPKIEKKLSFHDKLTIRNLSKDTERMAAIRFLCIFDKLGQLNNTSTLLSTASAQFLIKNNDSQSPQIIAFCERILTRLQQCQLLNSTSLQEALPLWKLCVYNDDIKEIETALNHLPDRLLTRNVWNEILRLCSQQNASRYEIKHYINGLIAPPQTLAAINHAAAQDFRGTTPTQSTHTASVEDSIALSSLRLNQRYPLTPTEIEKAVTDFKNFVAEINPGAFNDIPQETRDDAIKCIDKITSEAWENNRQKNTRFSIRQVIALVQTAIMDANSHVRSPLFVLPLDKKLADIPESFTSGLVIQEVNNGQFQLFFFDTAKDPSSTMLSIKPEHQPSFQQTCAALATHTGKSFLSYTDFHKFSSYVDGTIAIKQEPLHAKERLINELCNIEHAYDTGGDESACVGGTFNGLINALNGVHVDVKIELISKTTVTDLGFYYARKIFGKAFTEKMCNEPEFMKQSEQEINSDGEVFSNQALKQWHDALLQKTVVALQNECQLRLKYTGLSDAQVIQLMQGGIQQWIEENLTILRQDKYIFCDTVEKYKVANNNRLSTSSQQDDFDKLISIIAIVKDLAVASSIKHNNSSSNSHFFHHERSLKILDDFLLVLSKKNIAETAEWLKSNQNMLKGFFLKSENYLFLKNKPFGCTCFDDLQHNIECYSDSRLQLNTTY